MPRITPQTIWRAKNIDRRLPFLLSTCRDIRPAALELQWLREHAVRKTTASRNVENLLNHYVRRRALGEPLQYILGTEFFGDLEIKCRRGVLIPRQETAASVSYLVNLMSKGTKQPNHLRVLDLCTGTGCIPLLFHYEFFSIYFNHDRTLEVTGVDISSRALSLARENLAIQIQTQDLNNETAKQSLGSIRFLKADVLQETAITIDASHAVSQHATADGFSTDILISNPPYISSQDYWRTTSRSVRHFEPKLALVPDCGTASPRSSNDGDVFYPRLLDIARKMEAKIVLFEVADMAQATRVAGMAIQCGFWEGVEIWRDFPQDSSETEDVSMQFGQDVKVRGSGNGRSILLFRGEGKSWLGVGTRSSTATTLHENI